MRDFLGMHTLYHARIPLSTYYLMYVPYSRHTPPFWADTLVTKGPHTTSCFLVFCVCLTVWPYVKTPGRFATVDLRQPFPDYFKVDVFAVEVDHSQYPVVSVKAVTPYVQDLIQYQPVQVFLGMLAVRLTGVSLFLGCFRRVYPDKPDPAFNVMADNFHCVAA